MQSETIICTLANLLIYTFPPYPLQLRRCVHTPIQAQAHMLHICFVLEKLRSDGSRIRFSGRATEYRTQPGSAMQPDQISIHAGLVFTQPLSVCGF